MSNKTKKPKKTGNIQQKRLPPPITPANHLSKEDHITSIADRLSDHVIQRISGNTLLSKEDKYEAKLTTLFFLIGDLKSETPTENLKKEIETMFEALSLTIDSATFEFIPPNDTTQENKKESK